MEYPTDKDYEIAEQNGISKRNVYQRFWHYGWTVTKSITVPLRRPKGTWEEWKGTCKENNVSNELFNIRLRNGATPEKAAGPLTPRKLNFDRPRNVYCECGLKTDRKVDAYQNDYETVLELYKSGYFGQCSKCGRNLSTKKFWGKTRP